MTIAMDKFSYALWPELKHLPADVIEGAAEFMVNPKADLSGAFNKTKFINDDFVVKAGMGNSAMDDPKESNCVRNWTSFVNAHKKMLKNEGHVQLLREAISPTILLFDTIIVQKRVEKLAATIDMNWGVTQIMSDLAAALGIGDMHKWNWGFDAEGKPKMFDIDFYGLSDPQKDKKYALGQIKTTGVGRSRKYVKMREQIVNLLELSIIQEEK